MGRKTGRSLGGPGRMAMGLEDRRKIGIGLTGFGVLFTFLGIVLFFDRALLSMGNLLFISGVALTIGPNATVKFFLRKRNMKGSVAFFAGVGRACVGRAGAARLL